MAVTSEIRGSVFFFKSSTNLLFNFLYLTTSTVIIVFSYKFLNSDTRFSIFNYRDLNPCSLITTVNFCDEKIKVKRWHFELKIRKTWFIYDLTDIFLTCFFKWFF